MLFLLSSLVFLWRLGWAAGPSEPGWESLWAMMAHLAASPDRHSRCCLIFGFGLGFSLMSVSFISALDAAGSLSGSVWCRFSLLVTGRILLSPVWVKSIKASWSRTSCFPSLDASVLLLEMGIDRARLSLATGEGCLPPPSELESWLTDVRDGLSLGVGTVRVGDTLSFGSGSRSSNGWKSLNWEVGRRRESLGFGLREKIVGWESGFGAEEMQMLGFAKGEWMLCVLDLALGRVEALSPQLL